MGVVSLTQVFAVGERYKEYLMSDPKTIPSPLSLPM